MGWAVLVFDLYMLAMFVVEFTVNPQPKADLLKSRKVSLERGADGCRKT
jgi:hypothetical protein